MCCNYFRPPHCTTSCQDREWLLSCCMNPVRNNDNWCISPPFTGQMHVTWQCTVLMHPAFCDNLLLYKYEGWPLLARTGVEDLHPGPPAVTARRDHILEPGHLALHAMAGAPVPQVGTRRLALARHAHRGTWRHRDSWKPHITNLSWGPEYPYWCYIWTWLCPPWTPHSIWARQVMVRTLRKTSLSLCCSSALKSLRFALTSYFSLGVLLSSLYLPGSSIPVSLRADLWCLKLLLEVEVASLVQDSAWPVHVLCWLRSGQLAWGRGRESVAQVQQNINYFVLDSPLH